MILNLTQHPSTPDQGVADLTGGHLAALKTALTFGELPTYDDLALRAAFIAELALNNGLGGDDDVAPKPESAMIGGAPYLMGHLANALMLAGIEPLYAFSVRETDEQIKPDGSVVKVAVFRHAGFVPASVRVGD